MKTFSAQGFNDFIICLGYKGFMIKEYFLNYFLYNSDVTIELKENKVNIHNSNSEDFKVTLVDTGLYTKTAGRLKKIEKFIGNEDFILTYGDGLADVDLHQLVAFHKQHNKIATVTAIQPIGRYGMMHINEDSSVDVFKEKVKGDEGWINGGYFVLKSSIFSKLPVNADEIMWEDSPLQSLAVEDQLMAFQHFGFWKCMDALRDRIELEEMWQSGNPKWKTW